MLARGTTIRDTTTFRKTPPTWLLTVGIAGWGFVLRRVLELASN